MADDRQDNSALMMVIIATIALAAKGIFAKFAYAAGVTVSALILMRFALAVPVFWGASKLLAKAGPLTVTRQEWLQCFGVGLLFFLATLSDFTAVSLIDVGLSRAILFTFPLWVMLIEAARKRELPGSRRLSCFATAYLGLCLMILPDGLASLEQVNWTGVSWSLASAITYALYLAGAGDVTQKMGSMRFTSASTTTTLLFTILYFVAVAEPGNLALSLEGFGWVIAVALGATVIPFLLLFEGIKRVGATKASLLTLFGPALTIFLAWATLDEVLMPVQLGGFVLVLVGVSMLKANNPLEWAVRRALGAR